jgi:glucose/arabinose dehydrogenase
MSEPTSKPTSDRDDGLRMVIVIALLSFGLMVLVAGIAIVSLLRPPAEAPMASPESMRAAALAATAPPVAPPVAATLETPPSADGIVMAEGFVAERVAAVPKEIGSIASMCAMPDGSIILGPQKGKLARLDPGTGAITPIDLPIGDAQGLVLVDGSLYVVVNGDAAQGQGLYRVRDANADGNFDQVELLRAIPGDTGEHGAHGIVLGPDRKLYLNIGNHAKVPEPASSLAPRVWAEDFLLPRMWDANGHAVGVLAPGGFVIRTDLDGKEWEIVSIGYRNAYDLAFSREGELFTYDSDMEWDIGAPWYRPTTVCHVTSGSEFGWRSGSSNPPYWYVDVAAPVLAIGPGSPTGLVFGDGTHFPGRWQHALYCLDWTYATIHAVFLTPDGSSYSGERKQFLAGKGLPLTDAVVHPTDGAMYVSTGGRGAASFVYRIRAVEPVKPTGAAPPSPNAATVLRRELEEGHRPNASDALLAKAIRSLDSDDRRVRMAARTLLEHQEPSRWVNAENLGSARHHRARARRGPSRWRGRR